MSFFLRSSIIIYFAKMWFACLIFCVMAHVSCTKFSDWMPLKAMLWHCSKKCFPRGNFQSLYRGFGFVLPHFCYYLPPEGVVLNPQGLFFFSRSRCFESRRICFAPFLGLFASRRICFAPRRELKNAMWTVLVLCTKHGDAIDHLSSSKPHRALQDRKIPL